MKKWKYVIQSMTPEEKANPDIMNSSRVRRIAKGSGIREETIRELLKQYRQGKKMLKMFKGGGDMEGMMKKIQRKVFKK